MSDKWKNRILIDLLLLSYLGCSYYPIIWWLSAIGTCGIILFGRLLWKEQYTQWLGISLSRQSIIFTVIMAFSIMIASAFYIRYFAGINQIVAVSCSSLRYIHIAFYTLNEEMVLGALLLNFLRKQLQRTSDIWISVCVAFFFSLFHLIFYKWIANESPHAPALITLVSLFIVGMIRNNLILTTGHVGYSWALHFGFILSLFSCNFMEKTTGKILAEVDLFDIFAGNPWIFLITLPLAIITIYLLLRKPRDNSIKKI